MSLLTEIDDVERNRLEPEMDEYHPKSTRTLFVGNLEKVSYNALSPALLLAFVTLIYVHVSSY